jgi:hypothetical protein
MVVDLELKGKPLEASDNGSIIHDTKDLRLVERGGSIQWLVELEPGEEKVLSYSYERYVPSQEGIAAGSLWSDPSIDVCVCRRRLD